MDKYPLVTVFIPMYNCGKYIKESLDSIINQTYKNIEILIIDDGSSDNSIEIALSYKDKRIRLLENNRNMGLPYTRNRAINECKGKYIAFMDADDISNKFRIEKQVEILEKSSDIDVVSSLAHIFPISFDKKLVNYIKYLNAKIFKYDPKIMLLFNNCITNSSAIVRVSAIKENNIKYDKKCIVAQDYKFWCDISKYSKIFIINERLVKYREGHMNITKKSMNDLDNRNNIISYIKNDLLDFYKFELSDNEKKYFNYFFGENNIYCTKTFLEDIKEIVNSMSKTNSERKYFPKKEFNNILNNRIFRNLIYSNLNIFLKLKYYLYLRIRN